MKSEDNIQNQPSRGFRSRIPYKMFGKRFANTSRLMVSSKVWQRTIPTQNCDILLTFPAKTDDSTLMWLLARLKWRTPEIVVHVRHHSNSGIYGFYMTATYENLLKGAEDLAIQKPLKSEYGGGLKEFTFEDQECFAGIQDEKAFLTSQERQAILYHMLNNLRAEEGEELEKIKFLEGQPIVPLLESKKIISRVFPLHCSEDLSYLNKSWVQAFFKPQPLGPICEYFGVKIAMYFAYLGHYTISLVVPTILGMLLWIIQGNQAPVLIYKVKSLIIPCSGLSGIYSSQACSVNRTFSEADHIHGTKSVDDVTFVIFAVVNVMWATLFLEHWKRTSSELAYKWGTLDRQDDLLEDPRPLFKGDLVRNPVTDRLCFEFPSWKRNLFRYLVTVPVISTCLLVVFVVMLLIFELQEWINNLVLSGDIPNFVRIFPKIMLALSIGVLDDIYKKIAHWLNDQENYRLEHTYETALIIKLVLFQFVNSFLSLFYIAFYLQDMNRLRDQLAAILITRQVIGNIKEVLLPYLIWKGRLLKFGYKMAGEMSPGSLDQQVKEMTEQKREKTPPPPSEGTGMTIGTDQEGKEQTKQDKAETKNTGPVLTQAEVESAMKPYEDTWEDYMEMVIQFGYVTLFSSAFPLAALCAFINNIIEIRSDAFKLCTNHQRPFGKRVSTIGIWQDVMEIMGVIAVIVNCALVGTSGLLPRLIPSLSVASTILIIVVVEHLLLISKFTLATAIPDVPEWVAAEKAKWEFKRRLALKRLESQNTGASPDVKDRPPFRQPVSPTSPDSFTRSTQNNRESHRDNQGVNEADSFERQLYNRNMINANQSTTVYSMVARPTERPSRRLSETSNSGDGQRRVLGRRYTEPQRSSYIVEAQRDTQQRERSRNTSPLHSYSYDDRHDHNRYGHGYNSHSYSHSQEHDSKDTSPAQSTHGSARSPIKTQLLEEYIASYNSALSHDRSQVPSNKFLDSHLRKRNLSPIKVSSNPGTWRSNRSPSPSSRRSGPNSRPMSPIIADPQLTPNSSSPSPTSYKVTAPFGTEMTSPILHRRRKDVRSEIPVAQTKELSKDFAHTEKKMQFSSKNVGDCLKIESRIPVADHPRSPTPVSAPFALSTD
ncbi:anoctamin-8 isoform X2 [Patella vulgata]|uniref:anoctamin-8 isoform X2 n=1 Tax=Patella vulgata TaxID=6465 RepID=UPI0024A85130|nr:anoctamin-8 isoform X2 [Patella vulgata]